MTTITVEGRVIPANELTKEPKRIVVNSPVFKWSLPIPDDVLSDGDLVEVKITRQAK